MTVYVDNALIRWPRPGTPFTYRMSHMFSADIDELHRFALSLGLRREWFQCPPKASWPHYDVTKSVREKALKAGAVEIEWRDLPAKVRELGIR